MRIDDVSRAQTIMKETAFSNQNLYLRRMLSKISIDTLLIVYFKDDYIIASFIRILFIRFLPRI